tara:strand:- start:63 stop:1820 length:1758 start_codon:yes stop_codon:yes gene_type:complete
MTKYLLNTLILLFFLINKFSFAQTDTPLDRILTMAEGIKNGSEMNVNRLCDPNNGLANGPWYNAYWITDSGRMMNEWYMLGDPNEGDPISSQRRNNLSLIDKDGVVVFCEGESRFSGLVTAENVAFIGNGEPENIIVSPAGNFYFNLISLHSDNLQLFADHYNLDDVEKMIDSHENDARILINNVTFTNHNSPRKSQLWNDNPSDQQLESLKECLGAFYVNGYDETIDDSNARSCLSRFGVLGISSGAAIQVDRSRTFLHINNVIFKEFANVVSIIESTSKSSDINIQNTQIIDNQTKLGSILITSQNNLSLSNIKIINNDNAGIALGAFLKTIGQNTQINNIEVANNDTTWFWASSEELFLDNILFENNAFSLPFLIATPQQSYFNINNINFIKNRGLFSLAFIGSGRITESLIESNSFYMPIMMRSENLTFNDLAFNNNTNGNSFFVNLGNISFNDVEFIKNENTTSASMYSFMVPRSVFNVDNDPLKLLLSNPEPFESLSQHRLKFNNVKYNHRNRDASVPFILSYNNFEYLRQIEREIGSQITIENYQELSRSVNNGISIHQFTDINNLECGYIDDVYHCQ